MPRSSRIESPGAYHHVTGRGLGELTLFPDDRARTVFLGMLGEVVEAERWDVPAYCPLGTHYHLLVRSADARLGKGLQRLHGRYAAWRNRSSARRGPVWADRYHSVPILGALHVARVVLYIDVNAVAAGIVAEPFDWQWSSARANAGMDTPLDWHRPDLARTFFGTESAAEYRSVLKREAETLGRLSAG